jgi:hypothetical protein
VESSREKLRVDSSGYGLLHISKKSTFGEAGDVAAGDDQVIEHADVDERQHLAQALRDEFVRLALSMAEG